MGALDYRPVVIVAPEVRERRDLVPLRQPEWTDAEYVEHCEVVALLLDCAEAAWAVAGCGGGG